MTTGIYALKFKNTDMVYIGQSTNIERRFKEHLNNLNKGSAALKLLNAFTLYGVPTLDILLVCTKEELNENEKIYIQIFNSVLSEFNTLRDPGAPDIRGYESCHSKYTREEYIEIFKYIVSSKDSLVSIADILGVSKHIISGIAGGRTHIWLKEELPEEYKLLEEKMNKRHGTYANKSTIMCPQGIKYDIPAGKISEFERARGVPKGGLSRVINGTRKSYKGWTKIIENTYTKDI